jgi:hypothetical protein
MLFRPDPQQKKKSRDKKKKKWPDRKPDRSDYEKGWTRKQMPTTRGKTQSKSRKSEGKTINNPVTETCKISTKISACISTTGDGRKR